MRLYRSPNHPSIHPPTTTYRPPTLSPSRSLCSTLHCERTTKRNGDESSSSQGTVVAKNTLTLGQRRRRVDDTTLIRKDVCGWLVGLASLVVGAAICIKFPLPVQTCLHRQKTAIVVAPIIIFYRVYSMINFYLQRSTFARL